jgi:hypothetical protein
VVKPRFALACVALVGCTIVALSEDVTQSECLVNSDCDILNRTEDPDFDACNVFMCAKNECQQLPLDFDFDGVQPLACLEVGSRGDCDDRDKDRNPNQAEACDGKDNDCDLGVDEGMLQVVHTEVLRFDEEVRELGFAWSPSTAELGVVYEGEGRAGFAEVQTTEPTIGWPVALSNHAEPLDLVRLNVTARVGRFLAIATEADPPRRTWVGTLRGAGAVYLFGVDDEHVRATGLRCATGEDCSATRPAVARPELSSLDARLLAASVRDGPAADGCETEAAHPILLNLLNENFMVVSELTEAAVKLDDTRAGRAPSLVPINAADIDAAIEQFGWLAAYSDAAGDLIVRRVTPNADALVEAPRLRIERDGAPYTHVEIALGVTERDRMEVAVAAQAGCGEDARVHFGVLQLTWDATGRAQLGMYREMREIDDQQGARAQLAYNREQSSWGIAYLGADGVFVRVLNRDGVPRGDIAYRISDALPSVPDLAIVPSMDAEVGLFGVYSHVAGEDQTSEGALDAAYLRPCARQPPRL